MECLTSSSGGKIGSWVGSYGLNSDSSNKVSATWVMDVLEWLVVVPLVAALFLSIQQPPPLPFPFSIQQDPFPEDLLPQKVLKPWRIGRYPVHRHKLPKIPFNFTYLWRTCCLIHWNSNTFYSFYLEMHLPSPPLLVWDYSVIRRTWTLRNLVCKSHIVCRNSLQFFPIHT